jgi:hypothetical protein
MFLPTRLVSLSVLYAACTLFIGSHIDADFHFLERSYQLEEEIPARRSLLTCRYHHGSGHSANHRGLKKRCSKQSQSGRSNLALLVAFC